MRTQSRDTAPAVERILIRGHQAFSPMMRFGRVRSMTYLLAEANRHQPPASSETASALSFLRFQYGFAYADAFGAIVPPPQDIAFDLLATLERISCWLTERHVRFALTGSLACCLYGFPRTCHDIDLLIDAADTANIGEIPPQFAVVDDLNAKFPDGPVLASWLDPHTLIKVDRLTKISPLPTDQLLARAQRLTLTEQGFSFPVLAAEDVLLTRLHWYHATGSRADDQWNDLMGLVKLQAPTLDAQYLAAEAQHYHLTSLYQQLCVDTDFEGILNDPTDEFAGCPADDATHH